MRVFIMALISPRKMGIGSLCAHVYYGFRREDSIRDALNSVSPGPRVDMTISGSRNFFTNAANREVLFFDGACLGGGYHQAYNRGILTTKEYLQGCWDTNTFGDLVDAISAKRSMLLPHRCLIINVPEESRRPVLAGAPYQ